MSRPNLYHYTYRDHTHLGSILREGVIRLESDVTYDTRITRLLPRAVWFSRRRDYEPTALKGFHKGGWVLPASVDNFHLAGCRIGIHPGIALMQWRNYRQLVLGRPTLSKRDKTDATDFLGRMEKVGREMGGDPNDWFCSLEPVRRSYWSTFEIFGPSGWKEVPINQAVITVITR